MASRVHRTCLPALLLRPQQAPSNTGEALRLIVNFNETQKTVKSKIPPLLYDYLVEVSLLSSGINVGTHAHVCMEQEGQQVGGKENWHLHPGVSCLCVCVCVSQVVSFNDSKVLEEVRRILLQQPGAQGRSCVRAASCGRAGSMGLVGLEGGRDLGCQRQGVQQCLDVVKT